MYPNFGSVENGGKEMKIFCSRNEAILIQRGEREEEKERYVEMPNTIYLFVKPIISSLPQRPRLWFPEGGQRTRSVKIASGHEVIVLNPQG